MVIAKLICYFAGHHYKPWYWMQRSHVQYECDTCGEKTPWMNKRSHAEFVKINCPTWGGRGSDSQGYRSQPQEAAR